MTIPRNLSFLAQGASSTGVLSVPYGGTGVTSMTVGYIPYGNGTSAFSSSANLTFDGNNLGIGTSSPFADTGYRSMHINGTVTGSEINLSLSGTVYGQIVSNATVGLILNSTTTPMTFFNAGAERMRIDTNGNVGIGTSSPTNSTNYSTLSVNGTTGGQIVFQTGGTYKHSIYSSSTDLNLLNSVAGNLTFATNNTERMRIHASGGVSIGNTTDPGATNLSVTGTVKTGGYTVAGLPAGVTGARTYVTNALAPSYGATVVGGGSVTIPVFYNGTNWIVA